MRAWLARRGGAASLVRRAGRSDAVLTLLFGAFYFQIVWGLSIVAPTNLDWIFAVERDLTRYLTTVSYYRTSSWSFPITAFDSMLYPVGTSITIADGIPCFAVFYKLIDPLLPERIYQYFGLWLFSCVWLQAFMAKRILGAFGLPVWVQWIGVALSTADLPQALGIWHAALWARWTFLAGFYLVLMREFPLRRTCALVALLPWIHPYLLAMVLATVVASFWKHRRSGGLLKKAAWVTGALLVSCWFVGYFQFPTGRGKLGAYQADLLGLFNSAGTGNVPELFPIKPYDEGYVYLGLGGMMLFGLLATCGVIRRLRARALHEVPLLVVCLLMGLYAMSASPKFLDRELGAIPLLSELLDPVQSRLRCNGRFLWPLWHYVMLFGIRNAWEAFSVHRARSAAVLSVLALQLGDVGPWLWNIARPVPDPPARSQVPAEVSAQWNDRSKLLIFVPPALLVPCKRPSPWGGRGAAYWGAALFGAAHGMKTNSDFHSLSRGSRGDSNVVCRFTNKLWENKRKHPEAIFVEPPSVEAQKE